MSGVKVVPVEPTADMLEAYESASIAPVGPISKNGYKAMLAAAPAVQGEPVGYVRPHQLEALRSGKACGITLEDKPDAHNRVTIPLYTAPQPTEQQPAPDVEGLVEALVACARASSSAEIGLIVDDALETYRKQEPSHDNQ